jgi:hypothetical protein
MPWQRQVPQASGTNHHVTVQNQVDAVNSKWNPQDLQNQYYQIYSQIWHTARTQSYMWFICSWHQGTQARKITYQLNSGKYQIEYHGDKSTRTAGLTTTKILINSVISTKGARFLVVHIKNFYLNTPLGRFEYMVINPSSLPQEIIGEFGLMELAHAGRVYIGIQKGVYSLPQASIITNELLQRQLPLDGYRPTENTHGLWKHETRPVWFSLVVDDFDIKCTGRDNAEHLIVSIKKNHDISSDWTGSAYCSLKLDCDYANGTIDLSLHGYIKAALHKYQHPAPPRPEHAPHQWNPSVYGANIQYVEDKQDSPALSPKDVNRLQQLGGTLLHYARVNHAGQCFGFRTDKSHSCHSGQNYQITQVLYHAPRSYFTLPCIIHDIQYTHCHIISFWKGSKKSGRFFSYMGSNTGKATRLTNGAILIISKVLKHVMLSAAEAEIGAVFLNTNEGTVLRTTLEELGHPQPPTPLQTDSTTVTWYSNGTITQKRTRAMDMGFYWVKYRVKQGKNHVYWGPGYQNLADYFTKHHAPAHHKKMREIDIHASERPMNWKGIRDSALRGCVNT